MSFAPVTLFFHLGHVLKSHGTAGQVRVHVEDRFKRYLKKGTYVFLDLEGSKVPYQIKTLEDHQHCIVSLEGVDNKQQSDELAGKEIWIPLEQVKERHKNAAIHMRESWKDYMLQDIRTGEEFQVIRTEEFPQQLMAIIHYHDREIMIPLHEQLIELIDREQKYIRMNIPEGLLEL